MGLGVLGPIIRAQDMIADNPGTWLFHCHVADHIDAGMMALFTIRE